MARVETDVRFVPFVNEVATMNGNDLAASFICDVRWDELPAAVRRRAIWCLIDDLAAVIVGTRARVSQIAAGYAVRHMPGDEATILLHGCRSTAAGAAFANGCAGNALDIDDDIRYARGHPGAQLFPAALAVAEWAGASGAALLEALVVGYEIAARAARCWHDHHAIYHSCGSWGAVACAAVAARLMGLDHAQMQHALGIAEYHAPNAPMMRDIDDPAMVKHAIGWGALTGVTSAGLAACGFTGIPSILGMPAYHDWVATLGREYIMVDGVGIKRWCSCAWGHPALYSALCAVEQHAIRVDEIAHITVYTFHEGWRLYRGVPQTAEQAQFSIRWPLAALLLDGEVGPEQMLEHRLSDPAVLALVDRIEVVEDPEIDRRYRAPEGQDGLGRFIGRAEITLTDGRTVDSGIVGRGSDEWDEEKLERKFRWLAGYVLDAVTVDRVIEMAWGFAGVPDVRELTALLREPMR